MPAERDQSNADDGAGEGRQQNDGQQDAPSAKSAQSGQ